MNRTSTVLTGLALATGVARDAADGVLIVKQVLGVAARIVGLAELIDKNREDLHALADRAKRMDATITAIVGDRELAQEVLRRLEALNCVLRAIEKHFVRHIKRSRVRRTLDYVFTARKDVDRLKGDFDDRLRELEVAASIDTNLTTRADSRFIGEFRNIRHSEISLLRRLPTPSRRGDGYTIHCHLASCEGSNQIVVVRYIEVSLRGADVGSGIEVHDKILEQMSLVQNRHPGIAYLYGRNVGPKESRFVVLNAGDVRSLADLIGEGSSDLAFLGRVVAKMADACRHLQKYGAAWKFGDVENVYLDHNYEPKMGICNDLYKVGDSPESRASEDVPVLAFILDKAAPFQSQDAPRLPHAPRRSSAWIAQIFGELIDAGYRTICRENLVRRADIPSIIPLAQETWTYLNRAGKSYKDGWPMWGIILLRLATGKGTYDGCFFRAEYRLRTRKGPDHIVVYAFESDVDTVYHMLTVFDIPRPAAKDVRRRLGFVLDDNCEWIQTVPFGLDHFAGAGVTSLEGMEWSL